MMRPRLSLAEVREITGLTARALYDWRKRGWLHPKTVGRRLYFDPDELEALLGMPRDEVEPEENPAITDAS